MIKTLNEINDEFMLEHAFEFEPKEEIKPSIIPPMFTPIDTSGIELIPPGKLFGKIDEEPVFTPAPEQERDFGFSFMPKLDENPEPFVEIENELDALLKKNVIFPPL